MHMKWLVQVMLLVQSCIIILAISHSNDTDQLALLAFKSAIKLDPYNVLGSNWTTDTNFCSWFGVTCSQRKQRVTMLILDSTNLQGRIFPYLGNLSFLLWLDLRNNSFYGHLPNEIGHLRRLRKLIVEYNLLEGNIPPVLQNCQELDVISLFNNRFTGGIPTELSALPRLRILFLGQNNLTGMIPASLSNASSLQRLGLDFNQLHGNIPNLLGHLPNLVTMTFGFNYLSGSIPPEIFNISTVQVITLTENAFSGELLSTTGLWLPSLQVFGLQLNQLTGTIPSYLSNSSMLTKLLFSGNSLSGPIPSSLGQLQFLQLLSLDYNNLTNELESPELGFLTAFTNCRSLQRLNLENNPLRGSLPKSIGNFSGSLEIFTAGNTQMIGQIPQEIGFLTNLTRLELSNNNLNGTIPNTIGKIKMLQILFLDDNNLEGSIPNQICLLINLGDMYLNNNKLSGSIPTCIEYMTSLRNIILSSNQLSMIPSSLWNLKNLLVLNLSFNSINQSLYATIRPLKALWNMDLSWNQITGNIPNITGDFQSLNALNLSGNSFSGSIPDSLGSLKTLDFLDLSHNNLSGSIPKSLEALSHLTYLNLSFNKLSGEIPSGGPFANLTAESFVENEALCGNPVLKVPPCKVQGIQRSNHKYILKYVPAITVILVIVAAISYVLIRYRKKKMQNSNSDDLIHIVEHRLIPYDELRHATNDFSEANFLGGGSSAAVYKGILSDGTNIAVKVLNLQLDGAIKSFDAECRVLRTALHRNLVKVISSCSNLDFRALIMQYMCNGSLEMWLYSHHYCLDLLQRVSIMFDVSLALEYLHHGQIEPVVHCDLKPSNILLDEDMVAHVGDFGIAKILAENITSTQTRTLGTLGYIAPEYGSEGKVSTKGDVYSFGIVLMETCTRKKPTDEMFPDGLSIRDWVKESLPRRIMEVADNNLLSMDNERHMPEIESILVGIMELSVECTKELSEERRGIKEVVVKLEKIKRQLQQHRSTQLGGFGLPARVH